MDHEDLLEKAIRDMDAAVAADQSAGDTGGEGGQDANQAGAQVTPDLIRKSIVDGVKEGLGALFKANGAPRSDNTLDAKGRSGSQVIATEDDPAKSPKKSGQGYQDSSKIVNKGDDDADDDDDDDDDDGMPAFFSRGKSKGKKKMKKSEQVVDDDDADEGGVDATEFLEGMGDAVEYLGKSVRELRSGVATFGELLAELADPRRDRLLISLQKGLTAVIEKQNRLEKSLGEHTSLMKSISQLPGMPKVAGMAPAIAAVSQDQVQVSAQPDALGRIVTGDQRNALMKAKAEGKITHEEWKRGRAGDATVLAKAMA